MLSLSKRLLCESSLFNLNVRSNKGSHKFIREQSQWLITPHRRRLNWNDWIVDIRLQDSTFHWIISSYFCHCEKVLAVFLFLSHRQSWGFVTFRFLCEKVTMMYKWGSAFFSPQWNCRKGPIIICPVSLGKGTNLMTYWVSWAPAFFPHAARYHADINKQKTPHSIFLGDLSLRGRLQGICSLSLEYKWDTGITNQYE